MKQYVNVPEAHQPQKPYEPPANFVPSDPDDEPGIGQKAKGAAQMAAGAAVSAAGVPMLILPGPGVAAIAGGATLMSKGQRNFTGREATLVEEKLDAATEKLVAVAKDQAEAAARKAAAEAPVVAEKMAYKVGDVVSAVVSTGIDSIKARRS